MNATANNALLRTDACIKAPASNAALALLRSSLRAALRLAVSLRPTPPLMQVPRRTPPSLSFVRYLLQTDGEPTL